MRSGPRRIAMWNPNLARWIPAGSVVMNVVLGSMLLLRSDAERPAFFVNDDRSSSPIVPVNEVARSRVQPASEEDFTSSPIEQNPHDLPEGWARIPTSDLPLIVLCPSDRATADLTIPDSIIDAYRLSNDQCEGVLAAWKGFRERIIEAERAILKARAKPGEANTTVVFESGETNALDLSDGFRGALKEVAGDLRGDSLAALILGCDPFLEDLDANRVFRLTDQDGRRSLQVLYETDYGSGGSRIVPLEDRQSIEERILWIRYPHVMELF